MSRKRDRGDRSWKSLGWLTDTACCLDWLAILVLIALVGIIVAGLFLRSLRSLYIRKASRVRLLARDGQTEEVS